MLIVHYSTTYWTCSQRNCNCNEPGKIGRGIVLGTDGTVMLVIVGILQRLALQ